jgi:hypothetical protein
VIIARAPHPASVLASRALAIGVVACVSLLGAAAVLRMEVFAPGIVAFLAIVALTVWRPRYGLTSVLLLAVGFEAMAADPFMNLGTILQGNISMWSPFEFAIFSPLELLLMSTAFVVVAVAVIERRPLRSAQLWWPLLLFMALLIASLGWGVIRGGNLTIALWETRSLFVAGLVALLVPTVMPERRHVERVIDLLCVAVILLSIETIWRRFALVDTGKIDLPIEFAFAHETPIFMNFVILLLLARLIWPATAGQRLWALFIPLILYAQMLTERRAGWICLDVGLILMVIFIFRLRRKVFFLLVAPLLLVYVGYLAAFWNADGAIAEPARAVRSINDPEGRDQASNLYRQLERANIRMNIRANPLTGLGFGQRYIFYYGMPDLSWWPFWHYIPHNGVLFLWMKMGPIGFITFLTLCGAGIVRGVQLLKSASNDRSAPYLVAVVTLLLMIIVYSYVDIAVNSPRVTIVLGFTLGVIGTWGGWQQTKSEPKPVGVELRH